ncbi:hypothetical protein Hanom_Chr00s000001g01594981 [Helianthus anomalus]
MRARARAQLVCIFSSSSSPGSTRFYLLISILNKNNINNRTFRLVSSINEARNRARLLNKRIFRFKVGL